MNAATLREQFAAARARGLRAKDAAEALGVSEGEAIAAHCGTHDFPLRVLPLRGAWLQMLQALESCGTVMALTRNASTVHEKTGVYRNLSANGHVGLALGEQIDLRLFFDRWHAGFAVTELPANAANPPALSLQFYDAQGMAVHKVFARAETDRAAFAAIAQRFAAPELGYLFRAGTPAARPQADDLIDASALADAWGAMTDTHQFFGLLRRFGAERQQAFRLMEGRFAWRAARSALRDLLQEAAFNGTSIMVFVGSPGCIQIHTGPVQRVEPLEVHGAQWLNVLDPGFNLHLREDRIVQAWIVEKPTADGTVTSIEAFDGDGELMAMFFGARKPGVPEQEAWRTIVRGLPRAQALPA